MNKFRAFLSAVVAVVAATVAVKKFLGAIRDGGAPEQIEA